MPMRYAHDADVLNQLRLDPENPDDQAAIERVIRLENGLCETFDEEIGRSFGVAPVAESRTVWVSEVNNSPFGVAMWPLSYLLPFSYRSHRLVLETPLRSVTAIETGGTWDGAAWIDGETVDTDGYQLTNRSADGLFYAIELAVGTWNGVVRVTGVWGDQPVDGVPADVREAMTFVTIRDYLRLSASPNDVVGPDGQVITLPTGWNDPKVKGAITRHRLVRVLV